MSKTARLLAFALVLASAATPFAAEVQTNAAPPTAALPLSLLRDPFWPIGWQPPEQELDTGKSGETAVVRRWQEAQRLLQVSGLSKNAEGRYMAIVKGVGVVEAGDVVAVNHGGLTYRWKIRSIGADGLLLDQLSVQPAR